MKIMKSENQQALSLNPAGPGAPKVAALVPAFNEAGRIGNVIDILIQVQSLAQIIVIDDGSSDSTAEEARQAAGGDPRLEVIRHTVNQGKGQALFTGLEVVRAPFVLMIDADLKRLSPQHLEQLMEPVLAGRVDMTLGLFHGGYWRTDAAHRLTPWLTGQRCLRTILFNDLSRDAASGYGFETALTLAAHHYGWRCEEVALKGVSHLPGDVPRGSWRGPMNKFKMYFQIVRAWAVAGYWRGFAPSLLRRARLSLLVLLAFGVGLVNSFSAATVGVQNWLLGRFLHGETIYTFWLLWGKLKAAIDFLP